MHNTQEYNGLPQKPMFQLNLVGQGVYQTINLMHLLLWMSKLKEIDHMEKSGQDLELGLDLSLKLNSLNAWTILWAPQFRL